MSERQTTDEGSERAWWEDRSVPATPDELRAIAELFDQRGVDKPLISLLERVADRWRDGMGTEREAGYDDGRDVGSIEGYEEGYKEGYKEGYDEGNYDGADNARKEGYEKGYADGYEKGHKDGYADGRDSVVD